MTFPTLSILYAVWFYFAAASVPIRILGIFSIFF